MDVVNLYTQDLEVLIEKIAEYRNNICIEAIARGKGWTFIILDIFD